MKQAQFLIGLRPASQRATDQSEAESKLTSEESKQDVEKVKHWLENALKIGIGSRVSSGYGRTIGRAPTLQPSKSYDFDLWTQGMYGCDPPNKQNGQGSPEFRPTAFRGMLRYWFRAVALSLYQPETCQELEELVFGGLGKQGQLIIDTRFNPDNFNTENKKTKPFHYTGKITLELVKSGTNELKNLHLVDQLLILASHLGGIGRGSRRPLHFLDVGNQTQMRGCHWELGSELEYDPQQWKNLFDNVIRTFRAVRQSEGSYSRSPGAPGKDRAKQSNRRQDVLDKNAQVWLVKSPGLISPDKVKNWETEGYQDQVRGAGLKLLYDSEKFKGENRDGIGNPFVGGELGTPSFVWIKSIFPSKGDPYQVITIFGTDHSDRRDLANHLSDLGKDHAIRVFSQSPSTNSSPQLRKR